MRFQKVAIAGVGLLGGSLGLALKQRRLAARVTGFVRRPESVGECQTLGVVDQAFTNARQAAADADLLILCTPLSRMRAILQDMVPALKPGALVTDVGSVKAGVVQDLEPIAAAAGARFVGSHPMAGSERSGPASARADLFLGSVCVVTPTATSDRAAVKKTEELWRLLGARTLRLAPGAHDDLVSRSSHLPHVLAAALASYVLSPTHPREQAQLCANGFRDATRIASGEPGMWRDIAMANRQNLARVLGVLVDDLREFQHALESGDERVIQEFFENARQRRDAWAPPGGPESPATV